ncbi:hypothetical protein BDY19DRAFT_885596 [Irpex rosettiformis]|uniref:Uncharacterized protein n=1 Tax=Irpex rosettiformis TaxID=378272 RepID=A0ACB8UBX0_9APHY|nr:hypothetical protein BDY19DRAFT_885596 [Irpex rosettiformis]
MSSTAHGDKNRKRGAPLSCAECRRLKLRCSRVFPCASCVKKGCAAICPDGSLTTGRGNRFVLANTEVLHEKILVLSSRVRQLEDALGEAHQARSRDPHPLLSPDLLLLKRPLEREAPSLPKDQDPEVAEVLGAVGSLSLTEHGHTRFYGTAANAWYLLQNEEGGGDEAENDQIALPSDIPWLGHGFPFTTASETRLQVRSFLLSQLPEPAKARHLVDIYYRHCGWMYTPIPETELYANVFSRIYDQPMPIDQDSTDSHRLAVLYMVFALGTLMDLEQPYLSIASTQYYQLARAALSLDSILESQSIPAIQALLLMCHFMFLSFRDGPRWTLMGLVVKLAQSVNRDSGNWNLSADETFKRRSLLWEIYVYDSWQSLTYGRPPSFANAFIDCQMPEPDPPTSADDPKDLELSYSAWKHRFASRCLSVVHEQAFGARTPGYKVIQQLDKKVKEWYVPPSLQVPGFGGAKTMELAIPSIELTMQRHIVFAIREISGSLPAIFYLHRGFFARAIEDSPEDPLGSKYAPSVLAAYSSASTFVGLIKSLHSQHPRLTERHWFLFTHVFSCAIVLGSIAAKCPGMPFARSALMNLDSAYSLFDVVRENDRATKVLPVLQKLRSKAVVAMSNHPSVGPGSLRSSPGVVKEEDDELAALGGGTRLVPRKSPSLPSSPHDSNSNGTPSPKSSPVQRYSIDHGHPGHDTAVNVHGTADLSQNWQVYPQLQETGYVPYYPAASSSQWSPETEYIQSVNHSPTVMMNPASFHAYEQYPISHASYMASNSPLEPHGPGDVNSAWQSLYAQYEQPGMVG